MPHASLHIPNSYAHLQWLDAQTLELSAKQGLICINSSEYQASSALPELSAETCCSQGCPSHQQASSLHWTALACWIHLAAVLAAHALAFHVMHSKGRNAGERSAQCGAEPGSLSCRPSSAMPPHNPGVAALRCLHSWVLQRSRYMYSLTYFKRKQKTDQAGVDFDCARYWCLEHVP